MRLALTIFWWHFGEPFARKIDQRQEMKTGVPPERWFAKMPSAKC